jgi:tripartite-type tricarboxylate transporter receptor subunit TctC
MLGLAASVLAATFAAPAVAQDYPSKPVKFIVPTAPAGVGDIVARLLQQKFSELGNPVTVVVENRPGAAGVIGTNEVARAPADGYTYLVGNHAVLAMLPHLQKVPYDPLKGFAPVFLAVTVPNILVVHPSVPAKDVKELIAYAKANPGKLTYASQGVGASGHLAGELFKLHAGVDITHVPYKGAAPAAQDLAAGHVNMMFDVVSLAMGPIQAGRVRPLGVATKARVPVLPDLPTMTEQGAPVEIGAWFGLLAPAGTPPGAIAWVSREANKVFSTPDGRDRFVKQGAAVPLLSTDAFAKFIQSESDRYGDVIRRAGIKID